MLVQTPEAINWTVVIKDYNRESMQIKLKHKNNTTGFKSGATARLVLSVQSWLKIDLDFIFQLGMWQQNGFVQTEKRDGWFLKPPTRVVFNVLLWLVVSSCAALPSWSGKSHCDTQKKKLPSFCVSSPQCCETEVKASINTGSQHNHISTSCCQRLGWETLTTLKTAAIFYKRFDNQIHQKQILIKNRSKYES